MKNKLYILLFFLCVFVSPLWATTFTVSNFNDAGAGSLRQAIIDANGDGSATAGAPHIINISATGTIIINSALPALSNHMTINGHSSGNTIFRGNVGIFYRILDIGAFTVVLNNLKVERGDPGGSNPGGGIRNSGGTLTLNNCIIDGNTSGTLAGGHGGGLHQTSGTLFINGSTIKNNQSNLGRGGGVDITSGTATLTNCTVQNNQATNNAGAIYAANTSVLNLINCTVIQNISRFGNVAAVSGGVFYDMAATLNMTNTILANNGYDNGIPPNLATDLNSFANPYPGVNNSNIVMACNGVGGICPTVASTADPMLGALSQCGWQDIYRPNTGSFAIDNGTTTGAPTTDICGNAWVNNPEIGNAESVDLASALDFGVATDYVEMGSNLDPSASNFSLELWLRPNGTPAGNSDILVQRGGSGTDQSFLFINNSNQLGSMLGGSSNFAGTVTPNTWQHIALTWDGTTLRFYINGSQVGTATPTISSSNGNFILGQSTTGTQNLNAQLDEVRIWNDVRCQPEIAAAKDCELVGNEANLVHYYNFNQGIKAGTNTTETSLLDRQTNTTAQNGTLNNFTLSGSSSNWIDGSSFNGVSGTCSISLPEIDLVGNSQSIPNNSMTPNASNHTSFGAVDVAVGTIVRTFTIDNTAGTGPLVIAAIAPVGGNNGDFTVGTLTPASPIPAGGTATFTVTFDPSAAGNRTTSIYVFSDDCDEDTYIYAIEGFGGVIPNIAITEWLANPSGDESQEEWVELYNHGASAVDIQNWVIKDEDSDSDVITTSSYVIPAGGYLILAKNKTTFENLWFNGCAQANVIEVAGLTLDNDTDELILEDNSATKVWSIAYADDETEGRATQYTEAPTFTTTTWGSKASPGVNRAGNDPASGSLGYERNDATADPNARAASNGDMASPMDAPLSTPDIVRGNTLNFDGTDDAVAMGNPASLNMTTAISLEAWVYSTNTTGDKKIITKFGDVALDDAYSLQTVNGEPQFNLDLGAGWQTCGAGTTLSTNTWYHIAATYDGANMIIYINGVEQNAIAQTGNIDVSASTFKIGNWASGNFWAGQLDEVRVWNTARTAAEIRENMHLTLGGCETGLVSYYQFNEGSGTALGDNASSGNNGTIAGGATWGTSDVNVGNDASSNSNSQTNTAVGTGTFNFASANVSMDIVAHSATEDITATYQAFTPNGITGADGVNIIQNPVWTINKSSSTATILVNYTFTFAAATFTSTDPSKYSLYWREMNSGGNWTKIATANAMTATTATFKSISLTGQFMVVQESQDLVSDVRGNMYEFDAVDDNILVSGAAPIVPAGANQSITYEFWGFAPNTGDGSNSFLVGSNNAVYNGTNDAIQLAIDQTTGALAGFMHINGTWHNVVGGNATLGEWHHFAVVFDNPNDTVRTYVDGVEVHAQTETGAFDNNLQFMSFGCHGPLGGCCDNQLLNGKMDEVRIWSIARTQAQIRENMHLTLKGNETGLAAYYQFNNDDAVNTVGGVKDVSVNGNNGTTFNMTSSDYLASEVAVGGGTSDRQTIGAAGVYNFTNTNVDIEFGTLTPNGELVVYRIETETPHGWGSIGADVDNEYFVVKNFGTNTTFDPLVDITFGRMNYISPTDVGVAQASSPLELYKRPENAFGATWGSSLGGADNATSGSNGSVGYNTTNNITSFSQIVVVNTSNSSDLPVELLHFHATRINKGQVELDWATATETNNDGFEIERMFEHEADFQKIGWEDGQGTTLQATYYQFIDENDYAGTTYYRLKQIDFDGTTTYSEIRAVNGQGNGSDGVHINVYPNPVHDAVTIRFDLLPKGVDKTQIKILDIHGKVLHEQNTAIASYQNVSIDFVKTLPSAVYMITIELDNGEQITQKFIKE